MCLQPSNTFPATFFSFLIPNNSLKCLKANQVLPEGTLLELTGQSNGFWPSQDFFSSQSGERHLGPHVYSRFTAASDPKGVRGMKHRGGAGLDSSVAAWLLLLRMPCMRGDRSRDLRIWEGPGDLREPAVPGE